MCPRDDFLFSIIDASDVIKIEIRASTTLLQRSDERIFQGRGRKAVP
jgi:hypothetical protein